MKRQELFESLDSMEKFDKVSVRSLLMKIWENDDYFATRSFDVTYLTVKKMMPKKLFARKQGFIVRTT